MKLQEAELPVPSPPLRSEEAQEAAQFTLLLVLSQTALVKGTKSLLLLHTL